MPSRGGQCECEEGGGIGKSGEGRGGERWPSKIYSRRAAAKRAQPTTPPPPVVCVDWATRRRQPSTAPSAPPSPSPSAIARPAARVPLSLGQGRKRRSISSWAKEGEGIVWAAAVAGLSSASRRLSSRGGGGMMGWLKGMRSPAEKAQKAILFFFLLLPCWSCAVATASQAAAKAAGPTTTRPPANGGMNGSGRRGRKSKGGGVVFFMAPSIIPSCCLTTEQKDALIEAVHERPVIWDYSTVDYQDVQNRRAAFVEVAELLSDDKNRYSGPEMQVEWKKLRDIFNRTLKKVVSNGGTDTEVTWRYWQKLQFIADHERSQIFKAMQKWSKKVPPSCSTSATKRSMAAPSQIHRQSNGHQQRPFGRNIKIEESASTPPASMVQQLAEVAQTARELLGMGNGGEVKEEAWEGEEEEEEVMGEDGREEGGEGEEGDQQDEQTRQQSFDHQLANILLLGSQIQNSTEQSAVHMNGGGEPCSSSGGDIPKLLNELLAKGADAVDSKGAGRRGATNGTKRARLDGGDGEGGGRGVKTEQNRGAGGGGGWNRRKGGGGGEGRGEAGGGGNSDQFEIFGMFIASQVRTLHSNSPQSALRLKRALTELCFQFEAEQEEEE